MRRRRLLLPLVLVALTALVPLAGTAGAHEPTNVVAAPTIIPFEEWSPGWCPRPVESDRFATQRVVVHHSHDPVASTPDEVLPALREICLTHRARGFDTIGYHYVVDPWGRIWQARGGLPDAEGRAPRSQPEGAHVQGSNPGAVGVVFLGDHQAAPPSDAALEAAVDLLSWLVEATGHDPAQLVGVASTGGGTALRGGTVDVQVLAGHSATNATLCPGEHLLALLDPIRQRVRDRIIGAGGVLRITSEVVPAPDGVARLTSAGPILAAPAPDAPLQQRGGLLGLFPTIAVLLAAFVLTGRRRARRSD